jgi:hypothetical protein
VLVAGANINYLNNFRIKVGLAQHLPLGIFLRMACPHKTTKKMA